MISRPGRDTDVRHVMLHGDSRDDRLRAVTPSHPDDVCALADRVRGQLTEIVTGLIAQGLDSAFPRFIRQVEALSLPTS
jgi:hypothetical protein